LGGNTRSGLKKKVADDYVAGITLGKERQKSVPTKTPYPVEPGRSAGITESQNGRGWKGPLGII